MSQSVPAVDEMLRQVVGLVAAETAGPLSHALDRLQRLVPGQPINALDLRALIDELTVARRAGMLGQHIARLSAGEVRQALEPVDLSGTLHRLLADHRLAADALEAEFAEQLAPTAIQSDPSLVGTTLQALIEWCQEVAASPVAVRLGPRPGGPQALLVCRFVRRRRRDEEDEPLSWYLMRFAAAAMGARISVQAEDKTTVALLFDRLIDLSAVRGDPRAAPARLAGTQVLVLTPDRDIRSQVRQAIQGLDLIVDYVGTVDAARNYCAESLPQAVIYASAMGGASLQNWRQALAEHGQPLPFIEIAPDGHGFEPLTSDDHAGARVGLGGLAQSLPSALALELSRRR